MGIIKEFLNSLLGTSEKKIVEKKPIVVEKKEVVKPVAEVLYIPLNSGLYD